MKATLIIPDFIPKDAEDGKLPDWAVKRTQIIARARAPIERQVL
jgi:hypothetical protein